MKTQTCSLSAFDENFLPLSESVVACIAERLQQSKRCSMLDDYFPLPVIRIFAKAQMSTFHALGNLHLRGRRHRRFFLCDEAFDCFGDCERFRISANLTRAHIGETAV
jgi:hypothetical protein